MASWLTCAARLEDHSAPLLSPTLPNTAQLPSLSFSVSETFSVGLNSLLSSSTSWNSSESFRAALPKFGASRFGGERGGWDDFSSPLYPTRIHITRSNTKHTHTNARTHAASLRRRESRFKEGWQVCVSKAAQDRAKESEEWVKVPMMFYAVLQREFTGFKSQHGRHCAIFWSSFSCAKCCEATVWSRKHTPFMSFLWLVLSFFMFHYNKTTFCSF